MKTHITKLIAFSLLIAILSTRLFSDNDIDILYILIYISAWIIVIVQVIKIVKERRKKIN